MTARYKGRASAKSIERENPNIVELAVPPNGLGKTMDLIVTFHANQNTDPQWNGPLR